MNSNHDVYIEAENEQKRLVHNLSSDASLYVIVYQMRMRGFLNPKSACDFYEYLMDREYGRMPGDAQTASFYDKNALIELFEKCNGLFTYLKKGEKEKIIEEIKRLSKVANK